MAYHDEDVSDDRERPDSSDMDDPDDVGDDAGDDDSETVPCPHCRKPVYEAAERCPHCGHYLSEEDAPRRYPWWLVAGVLVLIAIILLGWLR